MCCRKRRPNGWGVRRNTCCVVSRGDTGRIGLALLIGQALIITGLSILTFCIVQIIGGIVQGRITVPVPEGETASQLLYLDGGCQHKSWVVAVSTNSGKQFRYENKQWTEETRRYETSNSTDEPKPLIHRLIQPYNSSLTYYHTYSLDEYNTCHITGFIVNNSIFYGLATSGHKFIEAIAYFFAIPILVLGYLKLLYKLLKE